MFLFEYDQEKHIRQEKDESREEGRKEGIKLGRAEGLELGEIQMLVKQIQKGRITMEEAAEDAGMTVEKFTDAMEHVMSQLIQKIRVYLSKMHIDKEGVLFHRA